MVASADTQLILWTVFEQIPSLNLSLCVTLGNQNCAELTDSGPKSFDIPIVHATKGCSSIGILLKLILKSAGANLEKETSERRLDPEGTSEASSPKRYGREVLY